MKQRIYGLVWGLLTLLCWGLVTESAAQGVCVGGRFPGDDGYCEFLDPCSSGLGSCNNATECTAGLLCVEDVGQVYGYHSTTDICTRFVGRFDGFISDFVPGGPDTAFGWAFDPSNTSQSVNIDIYADAPAGQGGAVFVERILANLPFDEVNEAFEILGNHGWEWPVDPAHHNRPLYAHAVGSPSTLLELSPHTFVSSSSPTPPMGSFEGFVLKNNAISAYGFAFDPSNPDPTPDTGPEIHLYADGPAGSSEGSLFDDPAFATMLRPQVNTVFNITGNHGWEIVIPVADQIANRPFYAYIFEAGQPLIPLNPSSHAFDPGDLDEPNTLPAASTTISPVETLPSFNLTPTCVWTASAGATLYQIQLYDNIMGTIIGDSVAVNSVTHQLEFPLSVLHSYNWRVRAGNQAGLSAWSEWASFDYGSSGADPTAWPSPPTPSGPSGEITANPPTFTWSSINNVTDYRLLVEDLTTASFVINQDGITGTQYTLTSTLDPTHMYRWQVKSGQNGKGGPWSAWLAFDYPPQPGDPDFCNTTNNICSVGQGHCESAAECQAGLVCVPDSGAPYGFSATTAVCQDLSWLPAVLSVILE